MHPHFAGYVGQYLVLVLQLDLEHRVGQRLQYNALHRNWFFFRHSASVSTAAIGRHSDRPAKPRYCRPLTLEPDFFKNPS